MVTFRPITNTYKNDISQDIWMDGPDKGYWRILLATYLYEGKKACKFWTTRAMGSYGTGDE
jgi:hypothetical protein